MMNDEESNLPGIIAEVAQDATSGPTNITTKIYGELMELANMLHDLKIGSVSELEHLLKAHHYNDEEGHPHWDWGFDLDSISNEEYADLVYEGRKLCEAEPVEGIPDPGYDWTVARELHNQQVLDRGPPNTWPNSDTLDYWFDRAMKKIHGADYKKPITNANAAVVHPKIISDRRRAVEETRKKHEEVTENETQ